MEAREKDRLKYYTKLAVINDLKAKSGAALMAGADKVESPLLSPLTSK